MSAKMNPIRPFARSRSRVYRYRWGQRAIQWLRGKGRVPADDRYGMVTKGHVSRDSGPAALRTGVDTSDSDR